MIICDKIGCKSFESWGRTLIFNQNQDVSILEFLILTVVSIYCQLLFWHISFLVVLTSLVTRLPAMTCVWSVGTLFVNITFLNISIFCNLIFSGQLGPEVTTLPALAEETVISLKCYTCPHCSFVKIIFDLRTIINVQSLSYQQNGWLKCSRLSQNRLLLRDLV